MTQTVTAVYENGVFRLTQPLATPPADGTTVRLSVAPSDGLSPGERAAAAMRRIAALCVETGPTERTSEDVAAALHGKADNP